MRRNASTLAVLGSLAMFPPDLSRGALASAAGLVLEAIPLLIAANALEAGLRALAERHEFMPSPRLAAWMATLGGCGCGGLPGALSLPAAALTWITFGPLVAVSRLVAGIAALRFLQREHARGPTEPLDQAAALVPYALGGAWASETLRTMGAPLVSSPSVGLLTGLLVGVLMPCGLGAVAMAASLRHAAPWAAAGLLLTSGLRITGFAVGPAPIRVGARSAYALLTGLALALVAGGGSGLVHPRFAWALAISATFALIAARGAARPSLSAPALACVALLLGSPAPHYGLASTTVDDAFAGQRVHFTGTLERSGHASLLVRYVITCCRADASPVALRLDRDVKLRTGTWATVDGVFRSSAQGLVVHVERLAATDRPREPFLYR